MLKNNSLDPTDYSYEKDDYFIPIQLNNWTLSDMQSCVCTFPSFTIELVKVCGIYIKENHPDGLDSVFEVSLRFGKNGVILRP